MFTHIAMRCGYAESCSVSWLIFSTTFLAGGKSRNVSFASKKEAITSLAIDLYNRYRTQVLDTYNQKPFLDNCCQKTLNGNKQATICSACGHSLLDKSFDSDEFMRFISDIHCQTSDSYDEDVYVRTGEDVHLTWSPFWTENVFSVPREQIICIEEYAEVTLLEALLEAKPELEKES